MGIDGYIMNVDYNIYWTLTYYPGRAKRGWLFFANRMMSPYEADGLSDEQILKKIINVKPSEVIHDKNSISYDAFGNKILGHYAIFIKVENVEILEELGAIKIPSREKVCIWELMDLC